MSGIGAGQLDQRITLQQRASGVDVLGQATGSWQDVGTVWARARPLRSRELFAAGSVDSLADVEFTIRWRSDVLTNWRVMWRSKPFEITGEPIDIEGRREWLQMLCTSGTAKS